MRRNRFGDDDLILQKSKDSDVEELTRISTKAFGTDLLKLAEIAKMCILKKNRNDNLFREKAIWE